MSRRTTKKPKSKTKRESVFQPEFREDLKYWVETDRKTAVNGNDYLISLGSDLLISFENGFRQ